MLLVEVSFTTGKRMALIIHSLEKRERKRHTQASLPHHSQQLSLSPNAQTVNNLLEKLDLKKYKKIYENLLFNYIAM
jgi:hypothetical protein